MKSTVSVITPFLNEEENINELCSTIDNFALDKPFYIEAIFVDDGSTDNSCELFKQYQFTNIRAKIVRLSKNYGSHAAVRAGILRSTGDYCMFFSADLQEPVELIENLYNEISNNNYDIVGVQKIVKYYSIFSKIFSRLMNKYAIKRFPLGGINNVMFNNKVREELNKNIELNSSIFIHILTLGFRFKTIPCKYLDRKKGKSKWSLNAKIKMFIDSFVSFTFVPIRFISIFGIILSLLGFLYAIYLIIVRVFNIFDFAMGWPTLISVIMIGFGITNISLGIIAEYLWRTLDAARARPLFIIDEEVVLK